ncbi:SRPBCC family protein [Millisia brevis]|uniref:SRPBCC family protein n=1 Tax=Millisia brevis TaxID=264148 RepID=UPI000832DD56|nr:SRPBCC domain-containing protein [Millisia brevis]
MTAGAELDPTAVEVGNFLPHPPEAVWRMLSEAELLERWLLPSNGFDTRVGAHFVFTLPPPRVGEIACEVLDCRPVEQLTITWVDLRADQPARWVLDWTLRGEGRGSRLLVTHSGFDITDRRQKMARNAMERGWRATFAPLRAVLDSGAADG